jgi:hypothetical protein
MLPIMQDWMLSLFSLSFSRINFLNALLRKICFVAADFELDRMLLITILQSLTNFCIEKMVTTNFIFFFFCLGDAGLGDRDFRVLACGVSVCS